jgi:hypothetical protein
MFNWLADKQTFREGPFEFRINEARPPQSSSLLWLYALECGGTH